MLLVCVGSLYRSGLRHAMRQLLSGQRGFCHPGMEMQTLPFSKKDLSHPGHIGNIWRMINKTVRHQGITAQNLFRTPS